MGFHIDIQGGVAFIVGDGASRFAAATTIASGDLDNYLFPGMYRVDSGVSNTPVSSTFFALVVFGNASNVTTQIAVTLASTNSYVRSFNTSWTSWTRLDT